MSILDFFKKKSSPIPESLVTALAKNEIVIDVDDSKETIPPDASKFGGDPWLPPDFQWPVYGTDQPCPLSFLCQIDLAEVKPYDRDDILPSKGMLYFFYDCESFCWGFDPEDKGGARVYYFEDTEGFVPTKWPEGIDEDYIISEMALRFTSQPSYPSFEELELHSSIECQWEDYDAALEKLGVDMDAEDHKLLGYAYVIQNEMLTECEAVTRGIYRGGASGDQDVSEDEEASIRRGAKDWIVLLQLTTLETEYGECMWGDCGMLYFYIKKQDLAAKRFENAWFALQCE